MRRTSLDCIYELAQKDDRVLFIGSDLGSGVLEKMKQDMPDRWYMEGVAEQHIIGMAAGLAMEGFLPFVNTIATFLTRRCFEQIVIELCLHNLPVKLVANGGGVVYAPLGPTHQAIEDIGILRTIPNMTVVAPCDADEMRRLMECSLEWPGPLYIRLAKGGDKIVSLEERGFSIGKGILIEDPGEVLFISTGVMTQRAIQAREQLQLDGIECGVLHLHTIKPIDEQLILSTVASAKLIVTIEEHVLAGGLGSAVFEVMNDADKLGDQKLLRLGIPDRFSESYGSQDSLLELWNLSTDGVVASVKNKCNLVL